MADIPVMGDTEDVTNILLIGIDGRTNYSARSDSNMIVSINKKKKTIKFVSLLRDTCVTIPGRDQGRGRQGRLQQAQRRLCLRAGKAAL